MMGARNRAAVVVWSPVVMAAALGVVWSLTMMLVAREPDARPMAPNEGLPSIEGPSPPTSDLPSSPASGLARAEATPHRKARARHNHDVCAAHNMRREDFTQDNHWRSWRCVR
jgi:hypothetical protein